MKELLKYSSDYFDEYFTKISFIRKRKWNYVIPMENGFLKGVYLQPNYMRGEYESFPFFTLQHDAIGEIIWNGNELVRYKRKGVGGTEKFKFHDTCIITATFANIINLPSNMERTIFDYRFNNKKETLRVCRLVCDDFERNKDKFFDETNTLSKIIKVLDVGFEPFIFPKKFALMATYLYLEMDQELDELLYEIDKEETNKTLLMHRNYISKLRAKFR